MNKVLMAVMLICVASACERPSHSVNNIDPCADKSKKDTSECIKKSSISGNESGSSSGNSISGADDREIGDGDRLGDSTNQPADFDRPQSPSSSSDGSRPFLPGSADNILGSSSDHANVPFGTGTDRTVDAGLAFYLSTAGEPVLVFTRNNTDRFSVVDYSIMRINLQASPNSLATQGQPNNLGPINIKFTVNFNFERTSCSGTAIGKISEQTTVNVRCR